LCCKNFEEKKEKTNDRTILLLDKILIILDPSNRIENNQTAMNCVEITPFNTI